MESDITHSIANFVRAADVDFEGRMEEQQRSLRRIRCINPFYGRWFDLGIEYMFSALELEDQDFTERFSELVHLTKPARRLWIKRLEEHLQVCRHCELKQRYELDLKNRIDHVLIENSSFLLQQLDEAIPLELTLDLTKI